MKGKVYWQQQGVDRLCGVHSINCLLQGPFFNQVSLAQIALELDRKEHDLMLQQGMTKQAIKYLKQESGNVANDGYYSIQVLQQALKTLDLQMISVDTLPKNEDLIGKQGFICNSSDHWFSMRKIEGVWYNLNSTNKRMPEIISDFYLSAFLIAVKQTGYQIFSVEGFYPESSQERFEYYNKNQFWIERKRVHKYHQKCIKRKGFKPNINGAGADTQMQKAIALSLGKKYEKYVSSGQDSDWDDEAPKKKQLKQFGGIGNYIGDEVFVNYDKFHYPEDDVQMLTFMKQSLEQQYQSEPKDGKRVSIRHPNGKKEVRLFPNQSLVEQLYDYVWSKSPQQSKFYLINFGNKQKLTQVSIPLFALEDQDGDISVIVNYQ